MIIGDTIKMVDIIRQGKKNIVDCLDCGSKLKYAPADVWKEYSPLGGFLGMDGT